MKIEYNKLIRDRIPQIIEKAGKQCQVHVLSDDQYKTELKRKLIEEANEVNDASIKEKITEEIADVLEIVDALKRAYFISNDEVLAIKNKKAIKNGRFENKLFLEYVMEKGNDGLY